MRVHVDDFETLHDFSVGVMAHAGRQANRAIFLAIIGGIVWRVHPGSVEIRFRDDNLANAALDERHRERIRLHL